MDEADLQLSRSCDGIGSGTPKAHTKKVQYAGRRATGGAGPIPNVVVPDDGRPSTPDANDKPLSAKDRWRKLSVGTISVSDDTISQCSVTSSSLNISTCPSSSSMYDFASRSTTCRRTLRGLQRNFNTSSPVPHKPEEGSPTSNDNPTIVKTSNSGSDLVSLHGNEMVTVTVESKITHQQLERMRSRRGKGTAKESKTDNVTKRSKTQSKMPSPPDIELQFNAILEALDLPEESLMLLQTYSMEKKWQMICDHCSKEEDSTHTPRFFTEKLWAVIANKNFKDTSALIKRMEIILRSTQINWLNVFLSPAVNGLNAVVSLLENMQMAIKTERSKRSSASEEKSALATQEAQARLERSKSRQSMRPTPRKSISIPGKKHAFPRVRWGKKSTRTDVTLLNLPFDYPALSHDIILLFRAMMNSEIGFMAVAEHKTCLNFIAGCLWDTPPKTQIMVLEMLTAVCMVESFHVHVVESLDWARRSMNEDFRFQRVVHMLRDPSPLITDQFRIALLNFINIIVHASPNVNMRVHLQYDLTALGFDECLGDLLQRDDLDPLVQKQISAYTDNFFDVQSLLENMDNPTYGKFSNTAEIQMENDKLREELQDSETRYVAKIAELEDSIRDMRRTIEMLTETEARVSSRRPSMESACSDLPKSSLDLEAAGASFLMPTSGIAPTPSPSTESDGGGEGTAPTSTTSETKPKSTANAMDVADLPPPPAESAPSSVVSEGGAGGHESVAKKQSLKQVTSIPIPTLTGMPAPPAITPPPPPPPGVDGPAPPPPPGFGGKSQPAAKKVIKTKYKMPALNWQVIRSAKWKNTIFAGVDQDLHLKIDTDTFEEGFKLKNQPNADSGEKSAKKFAPQNIKTAKILDSNACRNIGIIQRKLGMSGKELAEKINTYTVTPDHADLLGQLTKLVPSDTEVQKLERIDKNNTAKTLSDEEFFMLELIRIPRYPAKLRVLVYMLNFKDTVDLIQPQLQAVYVACSSVLGSTALKKLFELILTIGNITNSSRRGWTQGFQVASLDAVKSMKSTDGSMNLMNFLAQFIEDKKEYNSIHHELVGLERASSVVLSQVSSELSQLVSGLLLLRAEDKKDSTHSKELSLFLEEAKQVVPEIERLYKRAQETFGDVIVYLGESAKNQSPSEILGPISRFVRNLVTAKKENEQSDEKAKEAEQKKEMARMHQETANKLQDVFKRGNPLGPLGPRKEGTKASFIEDMLHASKTVAYRAR